jgi:prepilin-type N-terminal cleavage/methylation domain-containing protein
VLTRLVPPRRARRGLTLVELVAAVAVAGVVLAVVANIALRQQRTVLALAGDAALAGQLRDAASMLPMDVRGAAVAAGDLREASDSSIEVRETIASAVVCDTVGSTLALAPPVPGAATFAASVASMQAGDTSWLFSPDDSIPSWRPHRITTVGSARASQCLAGGPQLTGAALSLARTTISIDSAPPSASLVGRPLRVTRPIRYSLYRSSDGGWYLGARDWNATTVKFNTIQPVAGPFQAPVAGAPTFTWFDSSGARLAAPVVSRAKVALLRVTLRGATRDVDRALGSAQSVGQRKDSSSIAVAVRNRS